MNFSEKNIVITSAVRTAIGTFNGSLKDMQAKDLGTLVVKAALQKANLNSKRTEIYSRIRAKAENIAITALPLSSDPILGLIDIRNLTFAYFGIFRNQLYDRDIESS